MKLTSKIPFQQAVNMRSIRETSSLFLMSLQSPRVFSSRDFLVGIQPHSTCSRHWPPLNPGQHSGQSHVHQLGRQEQPFPRACCLLQTLAQWGSQVATPSDGGRGRRAQQRGPSQPQAKGVAQGCPWDPPGGRRSGPELRTHLLGGADACRTAAGQEPAEGVLSL